MSPRRAVLDPTMSVRVQARRSLVYDAGADSSVDRAAHVRAASGIARLGGRTLVLQDDALWLAELGPNGEVVPLPLPSPDGVRLFGDDRGNKRRKPDFEACVVLPGRGGPELVMFGSGSTPARERIGLLDVAGNARIIDASSLYALLKGEPAFAGSEMNIEGVVVHGGDVCLFSRGNGAPTRDAVPLDATCLLDLEELRVYLDDPDGAPPPVPRAPVAYDLGHADGVRLTFTDAATKGDVVVYIAAAEASPNAYADGPVTGVAFGVLGPVPRYTLVLAEDGTPLRDKVEGLVVGDEPGQWLCVVDADDTTRPADLLVLHAEGAP